MYFAVKKTGTKMDAGLFVLASDHIFMEDERSVPFLVFIV